MCELVMKQKVVLGQLCELMLFCLCVCEDGGRGVATHTHTHTPYKHTLEDTQNKGREIKRVSRLASR